MDIVKEFWLDDPENIALKLDGLAASSGFPIRTLRFGKSWSGRDLVGFRAGTGPLNLLVVAGLHAGELPPPPFALRECPRRLRSPASCPFQRGVPFR